VEVNKLGVVGFGTMGSEIALLGACAGCDVTVYSRSRDGFDAGKVKLGKMLRLLARDPKFFAAEAVADDTVREATISRLNHSADISALEECEAVIESIAEDAALKQDIFAKLGGVCKPGAMLATNTSSISISQLAGVTTEPSRVVGMHFFNPPTMMQLIEVIPGIETSEDTLTRAMELSAQLGKRGIRVTETPGFVVNRVLVAMMVEAIRLLEDGVATQEDIDEAMKLGAGFPLGPFRLCDLVGLDVFEHTCSSIYRELGEEKFRPPAILKELIAAGRLGRKSRHGFYKY
jgi:3-hydroxybutyryl-CoA dehydrogenase